MRQDASRSLEIQELTVIPQWIAGHADPGSYGALDRALSRWLAKQPAHRNQRVGFARSGVTTLSMPLSEEQYAARHKFHNRKRAAKKARMDHQTFNAERERIKAERMAADKVKRDADIVRRAEALPETVKAFFSIHPEMDNPFYHLRKAEWLANLPEEEQKIHLARRAAALQATTKRQNAIQQDLPRA